MICISVGNKEQIERVNELKPDLLELRFDLIKQEPAVLFPLIAEGIGVVVTCRPGYYTEGERQRILQESIEMGAKYVDIELEAPENYIRKIANTAERYKAKVIVSYHNYEITPELDELKMIYRSCLRKGADIVKIATTVNADLDNVHLLGLYTLDEGDKVVLGMGEKGKITRFAALELGAEFTFASLGNLEETAPGQLTFDELTHLKRILHSS